MQFWTLIEKIRDALKDQADILTWCTDNYGQGHKIYIGYDEENPPEQGDYPVIVITPSGQDRSINVDYGPMEVDIGYGLYDTTRSESDNVITYQGIENILAFRKIVEDTLFDMTTDFGGAWIEDANEYIEPVEAFPFFISMVAYTFRHPDRFSPILR